MESLQYLFENNRRWAKQIKASRPSGQINLFAEWTQEQKPKYLWLGCSDSRVPPNAILNLPPGEIFVHRNIANVAAKDDPNWQAVLHYAIEVLRIPHILVVGHYGCGGVAAALAREEEPTAQDPSPLNNWLEHIGAVYRRHRRELAGIADAEARRQRLCEQNVFEQLRHVAGTAAVQRAWASGGELQLHGWVYQLSSGLLRDLEISRTGQTSL